MHRQGGSRFPQEREAEHLGKAEKGQTTGHGQSWCREHGDQRHLLLEAVKDAEIDQPLADKTIQRRQAADGNGAAEEEKTGGWHGFPQTAVTHQDAGAGLLDHGTGTEKEQGLEQPVVDHMQ